MRRAIIATAGTVIGLVALLDYKSGGAVKRSSVAVGGGAVSGTTTSPSTTPSGGGGTSGGGASGDTSVPTTTSKRSSGQFTGQDVQYRYGDIEVQITVSGGKITDISIPQESATDPRSQSINSQAIPILTQEALSAQSMNFDVVSGATFTSDAFAESFQSALSQAGM
jgi:uncharacterized protein with FMN-binding domain